MDIQSFFTAQSSSSTTPATQHASAGAGAPVKLQGLGFIDIILNRLIEATKTGGDNTAITAGQQPQTDDKQPLQSDNPLLATRPKLDLIKLLETKQTKQDIEDFITAPSSSLTPEQQLAQAIALNQKALDETLKPLTGDTATTDDGTKPATAKIINALMIDTEKDRKGLLNTLQQILTKLQKLTQDKTGVGLALTNLTPQQITNLQAKINALLAKDQTSTGADAASLETMPLVDADGKPVLPKIEAKTAGETGDDAKDKDGDGDDDTEIAGIVLGLIRLLPPQAQPEVIVLPQGLVITPRQLDVTAAGSDTNPGVKPANDLSSKLTGLVTNGPSNGDGDDVTGLPPREEGDDDFTALLKQFSGKKIAADLQTSNDKPDSAGAKTALGILQNWPSAVDGSLFASLDGLDASSATPLSPLTVTSTAALTNPVTYTPSAGAPHPAMQMVAIAIQKNLADGQSKNFTLQLDPPELGRVEVRLTFGKDKTVKAVVTAEHSDTLAMLQRDGHVLERTFQNAGLDTNNGGSLEFHLANDGHFGREGGNGGSNNGGGATAENNTQPIETTMNWYVDEATGLTRYSLLV